MMRKTQWSWKSKQCLETYKSYRRNLLLLVSTKNNNNNRFYQLRLFLIQDNKHLCLLQFPNLDTRPSQFQQSSSVLNKNLFHSRPTLSTTRPTLQIPLTNLLFPDNHHNSLLFNLCQSKGKSKGKFKGKSKGKSKGKLF